jgi:hypothetical protein
MPRKGTAIVQYKLRIRESLRKKIEQAAKQHDVSANAEMARRLEQSFVAERDRALIDYIDRRIELLIQQAEDRWLSADSLYQQMRKAWRPLNDQIEQLPLPQRVALKETIAPIGRLVATPQTNEEVES